MTIALAIAEAMAVDVGEAETGDDGEGEDDGGGNGDGEVKSDEHSTRRSERRLRHSRLASRQPSDESTQEKRERNGAPAA